ncbi:MAG: ATP-binding cassette domain-containing protein, partial [Betaproteobacteria bacterium]
MQISSAFGHVQGSLSWFIGAYNTFATWKATADRLLGFHDAIDNARAEMRSKSGVRQIQDSESELVIDNVSLTVPDGSPLLATSSAVVKPGDSVLIRGPSGAGKSTLFRAIAGIWPFGSGQVRVPRNLRGLFLPQRPYLPIGTLREVIAYPMRERGFSDENVSDALTNVGLPHLIARLNEQQNWSMQLSPGEQQRVAFARAVLQQPAWLFLDEATSSLDENAEQELYRMLKEKLTQTTIISIGHRTSLQAFHTRTLELKSDGHGSRVLAQA